MLGRDIIEVGEAKRRGRAHILVVEDEPHIARLLQVNLERAWYRVTCVDRLNAARDEIAKNRPDVVILDMWLPGDPNAVPPDTRFGFDLSRELGENPATADLPVIIMATKSAEVDPYGRDRPSWLDRQGRPYLFKPFNPMAMLTLIKKVLDPNEPPEPTWGSRI